MGLGGFTTAARLYNQAPREVDGGVAATTPLRRAEGKQEAHSWFSVKQALPIGLPVQ